MNRFLLYFLLCISAACSTSPSANIDWTVAGGDPARTQYSGAIQIDTSNVSRLQVAWEYKTGDAREGSQIQCNPIVLDGILYATTPSLRLFALDASNGKEVWTFNPRDVIEELPEALNTNRGVTYWTDGEKKRLFYAVSSYLLSVDALTGLPDRSFGTEGRIDLRSGLDRDATSLYVTATSPGVIYKDLLILGSRVSESNPAAPGHIRAFDVRTGERVWIFHTIPHPGEYGFDTWDDSTAYMRAGGANSWSGMSLDEGRGVVYASTGSAAFDFYGGDRLGDNLFANSIIALDAEKGTYRWHFQTIHHDVWDRDLPAPPVLATIPVDGVNRDVAIQATKTGLIFVLDRDTGAPVFPVEEMKVPVDEHLQGEVLSVTQPIPQKPEPFMRQRMTVDDLNGLIPDSSFKALKEQFMTYNSGHLFTPPSEEGTVFFPGLDGGAEWGGSSFDAESSMLFINANEVPWIITNIRKSGNVESLTKGQVIYQEHCLSCHGPALEGAGNYPGLIGLKNKADDRTVRELLRVGRGMMPALSFLTDEQVDAVTDYVLNYREGITELPSDSSFFRGYSIRGYEKLTTPEGLPAISPPWGTLNAIDLVSGKIRWKVPIGKYPGLETGGILTGTENYGGPVATKGGVLFIAATPDQMFRVYRKRDGALLFESKLPAAGFATPSVYEINGKQFVVIACGGGKLGSPSGDYYVAFALP
ncbi:c-type cytochrome [Fulvivirga sedimenti]|uniref:C-type cytochrome n=1 Tax=Fulvivirga sedimenti TaxID=2879465 RepID=A0A9X1HRB8_9BACT|nr:c-type cytochrome [Fulvivirga sedimenti]MCA6074797.1 c-type cytochrome [Fulvivirga sedimenti]MCA6075974.1 c-type cytochrome [Fulvivirga sedimenti]MCA6077102.1 c-type cytochrome [Fulvivirga sedimenti]